MRVSPAAWWQPQAFGQGLPHSLHTVEHATTCSTRNPKVSSPLHLKVSEPVTKIKLGAATLDEDLARARTARLGLGPAILLRGDANGAWSERAAGEALAALESFDFDFVEQPLPAEDVAGLARLRRRSTVRIAVDESISTEEGALRVIAAEAAQVFVLKPAMLGGAARALEIATLARTAGSDVVFSHAFESAVGAHHALHCAAAWGDARAMHGLRTAGLFVRDVADPVDSHDGLAALTTTAGLGVAP